MRLSKVYAIPVEFINNNANLGVAKGNNQGILKALEEQCDYILLLNNDIEFPEETISVMVDYAQTKREPIVVPKIYYYGTTKLWMAGGEVLEYSALTPLRGNQEEDIGQYDNSEYIGFTQPVLCYFPVKFFKLGRWMKNILSTMTIPIFSIEQSIWDIKLYICRRRVHHKVSISTGGANSLFLFIIQTEIDSYFIGKILAFSLK